MEKLISVTAVNDHKIKHTLSKILSLLTKPQKDFVLLQMWMSAARSWLAVPPTPTASTPTARMSAEVSLTLVLSNGVCACR